MWKEERNSAVPPFPHQRAASTARAFAVATNQPSLTSVKITAIAATITTAARNL
jgi:hypothetical protein